MGLRSLLLLMLLASPLAAQDFDTTTVFGRVMQRRMADLDENPAFTGSELLDGPLGRSFSRLNDTLLVALARLMADGMSRVPAGRCNLLGSPDDQTAMTALAGGSDSLEAERWAALIEEILWLEVEDAPVGAVASPDVGMGTFMGLMVRASPKELLAIRKARENRTEGACLMVPWILRQIARKTPTRAGPVLRFFFLTADAQ